MGFLPKSIGCFLAFCCLQASADDTITNRFSGFATLGLVSNDNSDLIFRRDVLQKDGSHNGNLDWRTDSALGLQWQTQWSYQFETTAQLVIKDRLANNFEKSLEWAFARYRPFDSVDLRVGRMGSDIFMVSDYRQVGYAIPWVRPPQDTYGLLSFNHFDGVDALKRFDLADSTLSAKAFYGRLGQRYPLEAGGSASYKLVFEGGGASLNWEYNEWKARYSYASVSVLNNNALALVDALRTAAALWPDADTLADRFTTRSKRFTYQQVGLLYDNNTWWAQAELSHLDSDAGIISSTRHFYLSIGRRINEFTFYGTTGYVKTLRPPVALSAPDYYPEPINQQLAQLADATALAFNGSRSHQNSINLGVRWDFTSKMDLKFQIGQFKVDKYGWDLWLKTNPASPPKDETAHVVSLSLDMLF